MAVADARGRRWDAATGVGFVVAGVVAFLLPGTPPKADDSTQKILSFFVDKRDELLASSAIFLVAFALFLWFLGSLRSYLRAAEGGEGRLSAAAFGGGVAAGAVLLVGLCALNSIAFKVAGEGAHPTLVRAMFDFSGALFAMTGAGFAVFFGAASCSGARSGALPPALYWSGSLIAVLNLVGLIALFAKSGFFAGGGAFTFIVPALSFLWVLAVSVVIFQRDGVPPTARAEP
jgi:hypothetical protein